jgi:predicted alpha/beta superfamily hydrolase
VLVSLPGTYNGDQSARFPVIYLTDANWLFGLTAQSYHLLRLGGMVPDALIVGIVRSGVEEDTREGSAVGAERAFDLTPTRNVDEERRYRGEYKRDVRTGGGPAFLRVLVEELIPDIEARYRANGDRTLVGYSLGGLFGAYVLFQSPETFKRMVLVSPSLWWDGGVIAKHEQTYAEKHKDLRVRHSHA